MCSIFVMMFICYGIMWNVCCWVIVCVVCVVKWLVFIRNGIWYGLCVVIGV